MSRILISYYKVQETKIDKVLCFWDGLFQELKKYGNDLLIINTAYLNPYNTNVVADKKADAHILEKCKQFDPELIITFNHRIPQSILDEFDVPIVIWDGDELSFFCDLDYIHSHKERYKVFSIVEKWRQDYLDFGFEDSQIHYVSAATAIQAKPVEQSINISFLGIRHFHNKKYASLIRRRQYDNQFYNIVYEFLQTNNFDYEALFNKHFNELYPDLTMTLRDLYPLFDYRWLVLANMLDLGLCIAGHQSRWEDAAEFMPQLSAALSTRLVWTLDENSDFYNSSKISLCPITAQARGSGFSWRVFDIMASNACLLISETSDLKKMLKPYGFHVPMFSNPWEAREQAKILLKDEHMRKEIVLASQNFIEENARWIYRFKEIEQILGIKIVNTDKEGSIHNIILDDIEFKNSINQESNLTIFKRKVKRKIKNELRRRLHL